ncbi:hypothetical protein FOCG_04773 [Fusarium oxysporum f. sp. radicis-lycopersici 26381]|uniref:Uncharacterized protein n=2 Tax=Fusarium oxysporum TaxID=5507 RepID=A0A4Q2WFN4_FUSOX|nr:hypothetical protein FOWG_13600 [Fusarium oxysporum f. sp. lycopersici MN25]EXL57673.1 hypothetical protein FOCG_04773 [Fusarium oxysporum f. sp. radicis-lycopersici 26381]KAJ4266732.1 hypothetical protein NW764_015259 [Fusarium oxysporum]RKK63809.1 hypothetical protein BFJ66_g402 [Fusarium oxysporum f. sp. cepae]RYC97228.1 hypothetical protein BFJ63_vAg386 [Fusarium oxysporum f. sp. narcissi]
MMATEAAVDKAADATASQSQPSPDAENVDSVRSNLNGSAGNDDYENKHITSVEDQLTSADASASGGSDTEASRADASKTKDGEKVHGRAGSTVKKPAFKAVSVNKTFLAAKATANSAATKAAEKQPAGSSTPPTTSATLSSSRPRLIAKTGSSTRDSSPRFSGGVNGGKPGSAPDANAVWNKNRPVPPPEPKKFTDEELKKYGIHMASRLNEDDAQGQNKWADIDDDDEDWAPEAITWGDGTKTTLPHPDEHPPPPSDSGSVASKGKPLDKPRSPAPPVAVSSPLTKSSNLAQGKGLILKSGSQEKPTLVAKPPAPPAPVKSPWAPLPPVEKASPIPEQASLARPSHNKGMTPPPPKEFAADDFNRWRDSSSHGGRELFNSHSGRYEPVHDNRRGSMRMEQHPRHHPSLLQRPPQPDYPAEPSGAFQTNRVSQEPPFARRRGSSNVSGGSGSFMQRMNKGGEVPLAPHELQEGRRPSFVGSVDGLVSPNLSASAHGPPRGQHHSSWMPPRGSPNPAFAQPHHPAPLPEQVAGPPPPLQPASEEVEYQKKLMRERVELARKRRQEEEAREEAERRERIQKKLDAMGPAPEKKTEKKELAEKSDDASHPTHIQQRDHSSAANQTPTQLQQDGDHSATASSARQQPQDSDAKVGHTQGTAPAARRVSHSQEAKPSELWGAAAASRQDRAVSNWGTGSQPRSNVWGSPNNDRGLGNGTFNTDIGRAPLDNRPGSQGNKGPSPIAPPNNPRQPSQARPQPPAPIGSGPSRYSSSGPHPPAGSDVASKWITAVGEKDKQLSASRLAERVERDRLLAERGVSLEDAQPVIKDTWRQVHAPGDGTRRAIGPQEAQPAGPWRSPGDDAKEDPNNVGVVGGGVPGQAGASQNRASRFFPTRDSHDRINENEPSRSKSPTPPPPTMEGHPAYEGDVMKPHVSLPKPHPVVKLPPSMAASQPPSNRVQFGWAHPPSFKDVARGPVSPNRAPLTAGESSQEKWQNRINSLLGNSSRSPPQRSIGVDPASKSALDHVAHHDSATVSLPRNNVSAPARFDKSLLSPVTKPMAEECFEEQEMGSLPQIRLPHKAPEAAWQPALAPNKPLPKKFAVQPTVMEPYYFSADVVGGGNVMRIMFPNMQEARTVTIPFSATRGGRGSQGRGGPRNRGSGYERRGGKRDVSSSRGEHPPTSSGRGGRGSYRGRGSDWGRAPSNPASLAA